MLMFIFSTIINIAIIYIKYISFATFDKSGFVSIINDSLIKHNIHSVNLRVLLLLIVIH